MTPHGLRSNAPGICLRRDPSYLSLTKLGPGIRGEAKLSLEEYLSSCALMKNRLINNTEKELTVLILSRCLYAGMSSNSNPGYAALLSGKLQTIVRLSS